MSRVRIPVLLLLYVALLSACSTYSEETVKDPATGRITEKKTIRRSDGVLHGALERYHPDGTPSEQASYREGKLYGVRMLYREDGSKDIEESYENGIFHGPYRTYHPDGKLKSEGHYEQGVLTGTWHSYYPSGQLKETVTMRDNMENGAFEEYHENGRIKAKGTYKGGDKEDGKLELFDESGELIRVMNCTDGACITTWKKDIPE